MTPDLFWGLLLLAPSSVGRDAYAAFLGADAASTGGEIPRSWLDGVALTEGEVDMLAYDANKRRG